MKALIILIQPAFDWTWKNSLQVAVLVGLVLLVQTVLARWLTPRLRYALSLLILLRLLLPAVPSSPLSLENLFRPAARLEAHSLAPERGRLGGASLPDGPISPMVTEPDPVAPTDPLPVVTPFVSAAPSRVPVLSVAEVLGLAWACGLLALVSLAGWRYAEWSRLIRQGRRLSDPRLLALLDDAREAMGVRRSVTLVAMASLSSPAVFGFRRVRLLLPETMLDQLTDQDLRLLFLHEMAHVRRHDMLLNVLLMAVQFVHWFNPLLWLGLHRLRADRELVCDAMVLQRTKPEERVTYGSLLLKLLTDFPAEQRMIPTAVPVVSSQSELKRRIVLIKHQRSASRGVYVVTVMAAVALACLTFTGSSQQSPVAPALAVSTAMTNGSASNGLSGQGTPAETRPLYIRTFKISGDSLNEGLHVPMRSIGTNGWDAVRQALLAHLSKTGVDLDPVRHPGKVFFYADTKRLLLIRATADDLEIIERELAALGGLPKQDADSSTLVHDGRVLYQMGKLDEAEDKLKLALKKDPHSESAHYYLNFVSALKHAREPKLQGASSIQNPYAGTNLLAIGPGRGTIIASLDRIRLANVAYDGLPLGRVLSELSHEAYKQDPSKRGVHFFINGGTNGPEALTSLPITIEPPLTNSRLGDVMEAIVKGAGRPIKYSIEDYAVVFSARTGPESPLLYVRAFKVDPNTIVLGLAQAKIPAEANGPNSVTRGLRDCFARAGVHLDPTNIFYSVHNDRQGVLVIQATMQDLDIIEAVIMVLNYSPPQLSESGRDYLLGWYMLPNRHYRTRAVLPGPGTLIPVLKRGGVYCSVSNGAEIPLKQCPEGLEWGLTESSMRGTKIGLDAASKEPYIIIEDRNAQYEGDMSTSGEKQFMTKIAEPPGLLTATAKPPQTVKDFTGCYQPLYFPAYQFIITRDGDKYQIKEQKLSKDKWIAEEAASTTLEPLPDKPGFAWGREQKVRLVFNRDLKRYEFLMGEDTNNITMPLVRVSPSLPPGTGASTAPIGVPAWH